MLRVPNILVDIIGDFIINLTSREQIYRNLLRCLWQYDKFVVILRLTRVVGICLQFFVPLGSILKTCKDLIVYDSSGKLGNIIVDESYGKLVDISIGLILAVAMHYCIIESRSARRRAALSFWMFFVNDLLLFQRNLILIKMRLEVRLLLLRNPGARKHLTESTMQVGRETISTDPQRPLRCIAANPCFLRTCR